MKKLIGALASVVFLLCSYVPAHAEDRIQWWYGMNPPSPWKNMEERYSRLGHGQWFVDSLHNNGGFFANLCVVPATGLLVTPQPCSANTQASLYQYLPDESTTFGGPGATALATDNTNIYLQGLTNAALSSIGPLNPPGTSGQSIIYLIECQVQTIDTTSQNQNFVSTTGAVTTQSVNRDRKDIIGCQSKAGTASASPTAPTQDAGWIGVSQVTVAFGTATITSGMISAQTANGFYGFAMLNASGQIPNSALATTPVTSVAGSLPITTSGSTSVTVSCATCAVNNADNNFSTTQTAQVLRSRANGASLPGSVPPCYTAAGADCGATAHITNFKTTVTLNGACAANTNCTLSGNTFTLTGTAAFASITSYGCYGSADVVSGQVLYFIGPSSANNDTIAAYNITGSSIPSGQAYDVIVTCVGI